MQNAVTKLWAAWETEGLLAQTREESHPMGRADGMKIAVMNEDLC